MARDEKQAAAERRRNAADRGGDYVDALLAERRGYVHRGLQDRVDQVDEQLRMCGATPPREKARKLDAPAQIPSAQA